MIIQKQEGALNRRTFLFFKERPTGYHPLTSRIIQIIEETAPPSNSAKWDNSGKQIFVEKPVKKILTALDLTEETLDFAIANKADIIVTHHPLIFNPITKISSEIPLHNLAIKAIKNDISIYSAHTSFDVSKVSMTNFIANRLNLKNLKPLNNEENENGPGFGLCGDIEPDSFENIAQTIKEISCSERLRVVVPRKERDIKRVGVCSGSGSSLMYAAIEKGADVFITGDISYHRALDAIFYNVYLIDMGHFESEIMFIDIMKDYLDKILSELDLDVVVLGFRGKTPFAYV